MCKAMRKWKISVNALSKLLWELTKLTKRLTPIIIASFVIAKIYETLRVNNDYNCQSH